jgi:hypothetical protein
MKPVDFPLFPPISCLSSQLPSFSRPAMREWSLLVVSGAVRYSLQDTNIPDSKLVIITLEAKSQVF